jgi:hypothetical protein
LTKSVEEARIATLSQDLQGTILEFKKVGNNLDALLGSKETKQSVKDLTVALENLRRASVGLPETIENLSVVSEDLRQFLNTAKSYPSWVLFGNQPPPANLDEEK